MNTQSASHDKLVEALHLLEEAAREKKDEVRTLVADKFTHLKEAVIGAEQDAVKAVRDAGCCAAEKAKVVAKEVDEHVHENPWPYIGGVAAVSLLLGFILGRSRR